MQTSRSSPTETLRLLAAKPSCTHAHKAKGAPQHRLQAQPLQGVVPNDVHTPQQRVPQTTTPLAWYNQGGKPSTRWHACLRTPAAAADAHARMRSLGECLLIVCSLVNKSTACRRKSARSASTCTLETLSQPLPTLARLHRYYLSTGAGYCLSTKRNHSLRNAYRQTHRLRVHPAISTQAKSRQLHACSIPWMLHTLNNVEQASRQTKPCRHTQ